MSFFIFDIPKSSKKISKSDIFIVCNFDIWRWSFSSKFNWCIEFTLIWRFKNKIMCGKKKTKFLFYDLNSIQDPNVCAYIQAQQVQIISKKNADSHDQQALS
ncbi:hypothetical protein Bca4012_057777 [Brassica carinata]